MNYIFDKFIFLYKNIDPVGIDVNKIFYLPNPLPFQHKKNISFDKKNKEVIYVGRINANKGVYEILNAWVNCKNNDDWILRYIGDGPDKESLIKLVNKRKICNIFFTNGTNDVSGFYESSSIFITASQVEGFGLTTIEAMSRGCSVISTKNHGANYLIDHMKTGILVNGNDINKLSEALDLLIQDRELREKISINSFYYSKKFNIDSIGLVWDKILS
jgi:glycosyltransferase involved in cell wall biosynthesis